MEHPPRPAPHIYEFGPFRLLPDERQILRAGTAVALTPKAFDLLVVLVENNGRLVKKEELIERIWPDSFVEEANLSVKMSALRRALGEDPHNPEYIETVPRSGYRFVAPVTEIEDGKLVSLVEPVVEKGSQQPVADNSRRLDSQNIESRRWVSPVWPFVLGGIVLLAGLAFWLNVGGLRDRLTGAGAEPGIRSLAVLPFENFSGDTSQDYFAAGMTDILTTELARIRSVRVTSHPAVERFENTQTTLPEIARELNVDALLTGVVERSGDKVRLSLALFNATVGTNVWSQSYERDLRDVLTLTDDVTRDVMVQLKVKPSPPEVTKNVTRVDPEAFENYLRGKFHLYKHKKEEIDAAITELETAVGVDPGFAAAHAELAQAYVWKKFLISPEDRQLSESAYVEAEKALSIDPNLAVGYLARGRALWTPDNHFPHEMVIRQYRRALDLDPNLDEARNQLALVYCHIGALDEAMLELQRALAINPNNSQVKFRIGETLLFQGKYVEALNALRSAPRDSNPGLIGYQIAWALWSLGRKDEAAATLNEYLTKYPDDNRGLYTSIQAVMAADAGRYDEAEELIRRARKKGKGFGHFHHTAFHIACAYALMNKRDEAIDGLMYAANDGFPCYPLFQADRNLDNLRQDPRFISFLAELEDQWKSYRALQ